MQLPLEAAGQVPAVEAGGTAAAGVTQEQLLAALDTNKDGVVSQEELQQGLARLAAASAQAAQPEQYSYQQVGSQDPPTVCANCGNMYAEDANFCRKCGTPRPGTAGPEMAANAESGDAPGAVRKSSLLFEGSVFLGGHWFQAHALLLLVILFCKTRRFHYPQGSISGEYTFAILYLILQRLQRSTGSFGNRAESAASMSCFLALNALLLMLIGYSAGIQVYVLQFEYVVGMLSFALSIFQAILAAISGFTFSKRTRDSIFVLAGSMVFVAALVMMLVMLLGDWKYEEIQNAFTVGLSLSVGAFGLAATSLGVVISSDL
eukprot:TRINITY_DN38534_c0_g1_i1.p1 TRINITY_DN38534_c0_g1~~TRINITY_DN38534_c0_g1_i1.p1  ORF type:complete len:319 (+),score=50.69 TRINITY_DN38534_c0_g1_i1:52-1008(+)